MEEDKRYKSKELMTGIYLKGRTGTWHTIDSIHWGNRDLFLVKSEQDDNEAACIIIDENLNVVLDGVYKGFDELNW